MGISQVGYGFTNVGYNPQNYGIVNPNLQRTSFTSNPQQNADTVTLTQDKKDKSSNVKTAITLAALAGAVVAAVVLHRKFKPIKLAEHIDFSPAKTMEEAQAFAKQHFGIKKFDLPTLEWANCVNESFAEAVNKTKGNIILPKKVINGTVKTHGVKEVESFMFASGKTLGVSDEALEQGFASDLRKLKYAIPYLEKDIDSVNPKIVALIEKAKAGEQFTTREKLLLDAYMGDGLRIRENKKLMMFDDVFRSSRSPYLKIHHELGHINHSPKLSAEEWEHYKNFGAHYNANITKENGIGEYWDLLKKLDIGPRVSDYAVMGGPLEFVAEVYARMMSGIKFDENIMNLYRQYKGPMV